MLVIGPCIFDRYLLDGKAEWSQSGPTLNFDVCTFFRSFLNAKDPRVEKPQEVAGWPPAAFWPNTAAKPTYAFDHFDPSRNMLVTKCETNQKEFPAFLAYGPSQYGGDWRFDLEQTRSISGLVPPKDPRMAVEFSAVLFPGDPKLQIVGDRTLALTQPGATEILNRSVPLSSTEWKSFEYSFSLPSGEIINRHFDCLFGFWDALPGYCSVVWKSREMTGSGYEFIKPDLWENLVSCGLKGNVAETVYFRIRPSL
jgi:hypothetical protein